VSGLSRALGSVGDWLLGGGAAEASGDAERDEWWKDDASDAGAGTGAATALRLGRQGQLFDDDGEISGDVRVGPGGALALPVGTQVEVAGSRASARGRGVAVTRARVRTHAATSAAALEAALAARGAMVRQLCMSQSISRGGDEPRWYSVPHRGVRLPRYQLFDSAEAVDQDPRTGRMTVHAREMRVVRGRVWFG